MIPLHLHTELSADLVGIRLEPIQMFLSSWKEGITTKWVFLYVKISGKALQHLLIYIFLIYINWMALPKESSTLFSFSIDDQNTIVKMSHKNLDPPIFCSLFCVYLLLLSNDPIHLQNPLDNMASLQLIIIRTYFYFISSN